MGSSGRVFIAGLALALCAAAGVARAAEKDPGSGGLLALPTYENSATTAAPPREDPAEAAIAAEPGKADDTSWGLLVRGGYFGVPNFIADELFFGHPEVSGMSFGAEIRYHGDDGGRGGASIGLGLETASATADGTWQQHESDAPQQVTGEIDILAITLTGYWSLFPSWYVHPYAGIGIGAAHVKGHYRDKDELVEADIWIPALHIPIGLAIELGERLQLAIEGRFIDGIAIGGALQVRF